MNKEYDQMFSEISEFTQYESIPYSGSFTCSNCGKSGDGYHHVPGIGYIPLPKAKLVGWCYTKTGYMMVFECQECFEKFRYHNSTTGRCNWDSFKDELWLVWILEKK